MARKTLAGRVAILESQVASLQRAIPGGVRLLQDLADLRDRVAELEASQARRVGRENATPYLCANQVRKR